MAVAGLDIGSRSIELVLIDQGKCALKRHEETTFDPLAQCQKMLAGLSWDRLAVTGYGRKLLARRMPAQVITEIKAYSLGARHLFPDCRAVLDIGGQDTKAIALDLAGRVVKFEMNDRCAAGTGKFLEFVAAGFKLPMEEFGPFALAGEDGLTINSMCTVFAETEATSLMAQGHKAEDIALALHRSVVRRSASMLRRLGLEPPLVFAGGAARNPCLVRLLQDVVGEGMLIPQEPDYVGALGAALFAGSPVA